MEASSSLVSQRGTLLRQRLKVEWKGILLGQLDAFDWPDKNFYPT